MSEQKTYEVNVSENLSHLSEYEDLIATQLIANVGNHEGSRDGFSVLSHDTEINDFQDVECVGVTGTNAGPELLREFAVEVYPEVDRVVEEFKKRPDLLNHIYDKLADNSNVTVLTDHRNVIGVAIAGGSLACALYEDGYITPTDLNTGIFTSAMIKYTQLLGSLPTVEVLAGLFSETYFTLPPSRTISQGEIPKQVRIDFNDESTENYKEKTSSDKPSLTMIAGSGSRDIPVTQSFRRRRIFMGPLAYGTIDILIGDYVLPVGIDITDPKPDMHIGKLHRPLTNGMEAHELMSSIAKGMTKKSVMRKYFKTRENLESALGAKSTKVGWE